MTATGQETSGSWEMEGGERRGGPNTLPRWSVFTQEFPDTTGVSGAGIITHSKTTFAYLQAEEPIARLMIAAPDLLALAKKLAGECAECRGHGYTFGDDGITGFGPDDREPTRETCAECADIREVIAKAVTP